MLYECENKLLKLENKIGQIFDNAREENNNA